MSASEQDGDRIAIAGDPTGAGHITDAAEAEAWRRYRDLRGRVRSELTNPSGDLRQYTPDPTQTAPPVDLPAFRRWFRAAADESTLGTRGVANPERGQHWSASYLRDSYRHGLDRADRVLAERGYETPALPTTLALRQERHMRPLRRSYVQTVNDLAGATDEAVTQGTRAYGGAIGTTSLSDLASTVTERVDAVHGSRALPTVNARIIDTVNQAALRRYDAAGVDEVGAITETERLAPGAPQGGQWVTAGDDLVCDQCLALGGTTYSLSEVLAGDTPQPVLDTHPHCRCFWMVV